MHDDLLERRLRATLRGEADRQPFTITSAELERRVALRGRSSGGRRLTLLLAAAVAIGALGVGGLVGGMLDDQNQTPQPSPIAQATDVPPTAGPVALPDLDALITANLSGEVVFAQSHGPAEGPEPVNGVVSWVFSPPLVRLALREPTGIYTITMACLGETADLAMQPGPADADVQVRCDGQPHNEAIDVVGAQALQLSFTAPSSWRVVVRRAPSTGPTTPPNPASLQAPAGHEVLSSFIDQSAESLPPGPRATGLPVLTTHLGAVAGRLSYVAQASCVGDGPMRFAFGDDTTGDIALLTLAQIPCDGLAHSVRLEMPHPNGSQIFAGADPLTRWSLLITSEAPPVSLADDVPGWTDVAGIGPNLEFDTVIHSFAGLAVDGGGPVMVVLDCAGQGTIEVKVQARGGVEELGDFPATCTVEGTITSQTFNVSEYEGVRVEYEASFGQWIAASILVPDEATEQP